MLWEHAQARGESWHRVDLPVEGADRARFSFEVEGAPGLGVFFAPTIGPAEVGEHGARPWKDGRPNLVMFIADTFRADSLAAYGGDPTRTPNLNRLADRSLRFLEARRPRPGPCPRSPRS